MNKILMIMTISFFAVSVFAGKKGHRHHKAHVHGAATLNIAFDNFQGKVEFKAASEGVLGFEHEAKSDKDKKVLSEITAKFENEISSMIQLDSASECLFTKEKIEMVLEKKKGHGEHSDFVAHFSVICKKDLKGSKVTFDFSQIKGIRDLDVTLLIGDLQKSLEVKGKPVSVELK